MHENASYFGLAWPTKYILRCSADIAGLLGKRWCASMIEVSFNIFASEACWRRTASHGLVHALDAENLEVLTVCLLHLL